MSDGSALLVPLRSNGRSLVTGSGVETVRRRLKFASLQFDQVLLEAGVGRIDGGPYGFFDVVEPTPRGETARWQTPAERGAAQGRPFSVGIGREHAPGVPVWPTAMAVFSDATISWAPTLEPFAAELPAATDWISFTRTADPDGDMKRISDAWARTDERNGALEHAIPERFVRSAVIGQANRDLGFAVQSGMAVSVDPLHGQVVAERFRDDEGWNLQGFAVPIIFPDVGDRPWESIADLRRDRHMARFRSILREVEEEATSEAADGDIEAAARHAYERHLAAAVGTVDTLGTVVRKTTVSFVVGGGIGAATLPMPSLVGWAVGSGAGLVVSAVGNVRDMFRQRRSKGWVSLAQRISEPPRP